MQEKPAFPGSESKGREHKNKKKATENQSQAIWQTNHSVFRFSFTSWEAWGKMIHDLGYCNNTDIWPAWYIFHSTCSFNVSSTIKQGPFTDAAFSFRLWVLEEDFCILRSTSRLLSTAHMSSMWHYDLICWFAYRMYSLISAASYCFSLSIILGFCRQVT